MLVKSCPPRVLPCFTCYKWMWEAAINNYHRWGWSFQPKWWWLGGWLVALAPRPAGRLWELRSAELWRKHPASSSSRTPTAQRQNFWEEWLFSIAEIRSKSSPRWSEISWLSTQNWLIQTWHYWISPEFCGFSVLTRPDLYSKIEAFPFSQNHRPSWFKDKKTASCLQVGKT